MGEEEPAGLALRTRFSQAPAVTHWQRQDTELDGIFIILNMIILTKLHR